MKKNIKKRIVIIGDDDTGKTSAIKSYIEQIRLNPTETNNTLEVHNLDTNNHNENGQQQQQQKNNDDSDSSDSSYSSDEGNQKIKDEINSKLFNATIKIDNLNYDLQILDAGSELDLKENRKYIYKKANCVIVFYAINNKTSFESLTAKWKVELKKMNKKAPFILVGNKMDLRTDLCITVDEARELGSKIGARKYMECSTITTEGLKELFEEAVKSNERKPCSIS